MEEYRNIIEQFEESKILIKRASVASCRLALILIDNIAELILHERCESLFEYNDFYVKLNKNIELTEGFINGEKSPSRFPELSKKEIRNIKNSFPDKIKYTAKEWPAVAELEGCLLELHLARNGAYHRGETNSFTMYVLSLFYFRLTIRLFKEHSPKFRSSTEKPWEYVYQRYGVEDYWRFDESLSEVVGTSLLADMHLYPKQFAEALQKSIDDYVKRLRKSIQYLTENSSVKDEQKHFQMIEFLTENEDYPKDFYSGLSEDDTRLSNNLISEWVVSTHRWQKEQSLEKIFLEYCLIEKEIFPFMESAERIVSDLDEAIQIQIDIARGK